MGYFESEAGLQVGLVEAWKSHARVHRDEEGVDVLIVVVAVFVAREGFAGRRDVAGECQLEFIAGQERGSGKIEMAVFERGGNVLAVERGRGDCAVAVVECEVAAARVGEGEGLLARDGGAVWREVEAQRVMQVGEPCSAGGGK